MKRYLLLALCLAFICNASLAQSRTISGKITDATGLPLVGVTITVPATKAKTVSREDGSFTISVPATAKAIEFSYVGYATQTIAVTNSSSVDVTMQPATAELTGVVVTG